MATYRVTTESMHINMYDVEADSAEEAAAKFEDDDRWGILVDSYGDGEENVADVREVKT